MTFLFITILIIAVIVLGILFYYQNKRQEKLAARDVILTGWCETLMENEETLTKDFQKLYHEFKALEKEDSKRDRWPKET